MRGLACAGVLLLVTLALWAASRYAAAHYKIGPRWLETGDIYTADALRQWVREDRARAARYAVPILVPLDLAFLLLIGATLAVASLTFAEMTRAFGGASWVFVLLPALFAVADLGEDGALVSMLTQPGMISEGMVRATRTLTRIKLWALKLAVAQTAILAVAAVLWRR